MKVFGPVPSRRLGQSLGINNIPLKTCSYSCTYCQIGSTNNMQITRNSFFKPDTLIRKVENKINALKKAKKQIDYITFVPDGEPTLDVNLGLEIRLLKQFGIKIAVITNSSLLWMDSVKEDLMDADWISLKIDTLNSEIWHKIDRPHGCLNIKKILTGIIDFASSFKATLVTETMILKNQNDSKECINNIGILLSQIKPACAYLLTPTRPPAENDVKSINIEQLNGLSSALHNIAGVPVKFIATEDKDEFFITNDDAINDLLNIMSVHPIRDDILDKLLNKHKCDKNIIDSLVDQNIIKRITYGNKIFYKKAIRNKS